MFVEADANKAAAKYDNASIDFQVEFYRREGLTPYSEAKLPITSGKAMSLMHIFYHEAFIDFHFGMSHEVATFPFLDLFKFNLLFAHCYRYKELMILLYPT